MRQIDAITFNANSITQNCGICGVCGEKEEVIVCLLIAAARMCGKASFNLINFLSILSGILWESLSCIELPLGGCLKISQNFIEMIECLKGSKSIVIPLSMILC